MAKYNGHKNWNHWNVSLWINNDCGLYFLAKKCISECRTRKAAAYLMLHDYLLFNGTTHTPDGAPYSKTTILAAMRGII